MLSASTSRRQEFRGHPFFLFPWGFHFRDCLVTFETGLRRVCPIHLHRLCRISSSAGRWSVLCHRSLLLMVLGQWIRSSRLKQLLMKVWILLMVYTVVLHVSAPYSRTDFTLVLKIRIFVVMVR